MWEGGKAEKRGSRRLTDEEGVVGRRRKGEESWRNVKGVVKCPRGVAGDEEEVGKGESVGGK